jgi:TorA maturation chaperone TorD
MSIMRTEVRMNISEFMFHEGKSGDCYRLLAACFYPPRKESFVQQGVIENLAASFESVCPEAAPLSTRMKDALHRYSDQDLSVEYAKLFVGPYELKAPPYGSVYLDKGRRVMGDSTIEVMEMYQEEGLSIHDEFKELPDHIAVELEFMVYLIHKEVNALKDSDIDKAVQSKERQEFFLNKFLRPWVSLFCERIRDGTDNEFYRALADCLAAFVNSSQLSMNLPAFLAGRNIAV